MTITLREYQKQDFKALEHIIRKTWHYDEFAGPETASRLAAVFLSSCLTNYTFSCVALEDGIPVGIILVNNKSIYKCPLHLKIQQLKSVITLFLSAEGRKVSRIFGNVNGIDKQLLNDCGKSYPAELALFAVDSAYRGKGIGKVLFGAALEYMKVQQINEFYLFTDTSCNYGFYEHQGMKRRCEREHVFNINGQTAEMKFFIYDFAMACTSTN